MPRKPIAEKPDYAQEIVDKIIISLEEGVPAWRKPWAGGFSGKLPKRSTGELYQGVNVIVLWMSAVAGGYAAHHWMTYRQAEELGGQVRKGERSTRVVKYGTVIKDNEEDTAGENARVRKYLKAYPVFNADQIDGLPAQYYASESDREAATIGADDVDPRVAPFFESLDATVIHGAGRACYVPSLDEIRMPHIADFDRASLYWATRAHETTHWTSAASRCDRILGKKFGDPQYAVEELIAEIGSAILGAHLGLPPDHIHDHHAAYVGNWLGALKNDRAILFFAAGKAQEAVNFLLDAAQPRLLDIAA